MRTKKRIKKKSKKKRAGTTKQKKIGADIELNDSIKPFESRKLLATHVEQGRPPRAQMEQLLVPIHVRAMKKK